MKIKIEKLEKLIKTALQKKYNEENTNLITEVLMFGELSGKTSHGIIRLESIMSESPKGKPELIHKTKLSAIIKGNGNPGMLIGSLATKEVISLAQKNDFGIVGSRGTFSSSGSLSFYLEKIAEENLIGIIMAQSPESTPPYGGIQPLFGTNPIGFGFPTKNKPLIFDMGTSAISFGAMLEAKALGKRLPMSVALDKEGNVTDDPNKAVKGATLPFDRSYKGAGLAMVVEVMAGLWPGAWFTIHNKEAGWGNLFMAFSPELLLNLDEFKDKVTKIVETIRNSKTKDGSKVRISGERTFQKREEALKKGFMKVEDKLLDLLKELAK